MLHTFLIIVYANESFRYYPKSIPNFDILIPSRKLEFRSIPCGIDMVNFTKGYCLVLGGSKVDVI